MYSGKLVTRVLGTSFWVKKGGEEHQMQVEVVCGKVSVFENESIGAEEPASQTKHQFNKGVILTPNQRVTYFEESGHLMTSLVDKPVLLTAHVELPPAIYKNMALPEIFQRLEDAYGVDIVVSGEAVNECTFTGDLTNMSLFDQLDLICQSNRRLLSGSGDAHPGFGSRLQVIFVSPKYRLCIKPVPKSKKETGRKLPCRSVLSHCRKSAKMRQQGIQ